VLFFLLVDVWKLDKCNINIYLDRILKILTEQPLVQSWPEISMATRPGQRTLEAARGNGYAPVRGTVVMMMMMMNR